MDMKVGLSSRHDKELAENFCKLAHLRPFEEVMQNFSAYVRRINLTRLLAYYELFKHIQFLPGWIVECGIYRGFSFFALGKFLEIFCMGDKTRKILGFDNFNGFTELHEEDGSEDRAVTRHVGGTNPKDFREDFFALLKLNNDDCFAPWSERMIVVEGDACQTIPAYCKQHPGLRVAMLHIDIDIYKPVSMALENLYPKVLPGGIVVLDEFAHQDWPGESKAVQDVFLANNWGIPNFKTFGWVGSPTTYFIKERW